MPDPVPNPDIECLPVTYRTVRVGELGKLIAVGWEVVPSSAHTPTDGVTLVIVWKHLTPDELREEKQ